MIFFHILFVDIYMECRYTVSKYVYIYIFVYIIISKGISITFRCSSRRDLKVLF